MKETALQARYQGLADAGAPQINAPDSRLKIPDAKLTAKEAVNE